MVPPLGGVLLGAVPLPYQQDFWYPYAGSVCETTPFEQPTPFVKGPLRVYISEGVVVPKTTFAVPVNEQNPSSDAHCV